MSTISRVEFDLSTLKTYNETTQAFEDAELKGSLYTVAGVTDATGALRRLSMAELVMVVCLARAAEKERAVVELMKEMSNTTDVLNALTEIEMKLIEGQALNTITGSWKYDGQTYTKAVDFLGAIGILPIDENKLQNRNSLSTLAAELENASVFQCGGTYYWDGYYRNGYGILEQSGSLSGTYNDISASDAYYKAAELIIRGNVPLTHEESFDLVTTYPGIIPEGTAEDAGYQIESLFYQNSVRDKIEEIINTMQVVTGTIPSTDQLITDIESKMDSMNSFSQQKMIELQSETNKRDQAYDMITNILKSMHTVQVGIVNNM